MLFSYFTILIHVLGVADGVGGWRQYGIDSSKFASSLMEGCRKFVISGGLDIQSPFAILKSAFKEMTELKDSIFGMSNDVMYSCSDYI